MAEWTKKPLSNFLLDKHQPMQSTARHNAAVLADQRPATNLVSQLSLQTQAQRVAAAVLRDQRNRPTMTQQPGTASDMLSDSKPLHQATSASSVPLQRKMIVNQSPVIPYPEGEPNEAFCNRRKITLPAEKQGWLGDPYARHYQSVDELEKHVNGEAVDCGLAKKYGRWYRLNFFSEGTFFVLGENHGGFGYRELIRESNQSGKVLGEGGTNAYMKVAPEQPQQSNHAPAALHPRQGASQEFIMENLVAKSYYGLTQFRNIERMLAQGTSSAVSPKEDENTWLSEYQKPEAERGRTAVGLPYYVKSGQKVFAAYGTHAEKYSLSKTALRMLTALYTAVDAKSVRDNDEADVWSCMSYFLGLNGFSTRPVEGKWNEKDEKQYDILATSLEKMAKAEADQMLGTDAHVQHQALLQSQQARQVKDKQADERSSFAYRDLAMLNAILKARNDNFIMAGIGDWHAQNLQASLHTHGIPVVLLQDFLNSSADAIQPVEEVDSQWEEKKLAQQKACLELQQEIALQQREQLAAPSPLPGAMSSENSQGNVHVTESIHHNLLILGVLIPAGALIAYYLLEAYLSKFLAGSGDHNSIGNPA